MGIREYRQVARGRRTPAYKKSARAGVGVADLSGASDEALWAANDSPQVGESGSSLLDVKIELARRLLRRCTLCERRCGADRLSGEAGFCGAGSGSFYFKDGLLFAEEPPLIPSHEVFLSGCNMRCRFCYSHQSLYNTSLGTRFVPEEFARVAERRRQEGAVNINLIGGEPTVHLFSILKMLRALETSTAVVWNSNFYMSEETMRLLPGVVDLFVGDMRFGNNACAAGLADTERYFDVACRNYLLAAEGTDLVMRHLLLPGHVECCFEPIARWASENLPGVPFNLMFGYTPFHKALEDPSLARAVTPEEEAAALEIAAKYGLNIKRWMRPLRRPDTEITVRREEISTTITIRPDGKIGIMHLHAGLLPLVQALGNEGEQDG